MLPVSTCMMDLLFLRAGRLKAGMKGLPPVMDDDDTISFNACILKYERSGNKRRKVQLGHEVVHQRTCNYEASTKMRWPAFQLWQRTSYIIQIWSFLEWTCISVLLSHLWNFLHKEYHYLIINSIIYLITSIFGAFRDLGLFFFSLFSYHFFRQILLDVLADHCRRIKRLYCIYLFYS